MGTFYLNSHLRIRIGWLLFLCGVGIPGFGQGLSGKIIDGSGVPVPYANVVWLSPADSSFVRGTTSDSCGLFSLDSPSLTQKLLKVSCIGYQTVMRLVSGRDAGTIRLREDASLLREVVVKGTGPLHQMTVEGLRTNGNLWLESFG